MKNLDNTEKLKDYLIGKGGNNGYLLNDEISNGKVIMLSGAWGSGKTHFWCNSKDSIQLKLDKKRKANIYISLYGKSSLQEIENEVFIKAYYKSVGKDNANKDVIEKLSSTFSSLSSAIDQFSTIQVAPYVDFVNSLIKDSKDKKAIKFMEKGLIICFDDFERKSSKINLNDIFGFITNLALQYKATIVIILNDDVFEGKDKKIFANIKEKSVSKFFKFQPSSENLLNMIYSKYNIDDKYKIVILTAINDMDSINARIYENILENLKEYIIKYHDITDEEIRYFVLTVMNFNLNHVVFKFYDYPSDYGDEFKLPSYFTNLKDVPINLLNKLGEQISQNKGKFHTQLELIDLMKTFISSEYKNTEEPNKKKEVKPTEKLVEDLKKVDKYTDIIWFFWKLETLLEYRKNITEDNIKRMNDFIETGIL